MVGGVGEDRIRALHDVGSGGFLPDRPLLLHVPNEEAAKRTSRRDGANPDRFGARDQAYHDAINRAFEQLAADDPERFRLVEASGSEDDVTARLIAALEDLL